MTLGPEWLATLLALAASLAALAAVAYACLRVLLEVRRQSRETVALLRAIRERLAAPRPADPGALTRVLLEGGLRELRRLAGLTQASLESSVRQLGRVADSASAATADVEVLPPLRAGPAPATPGGPPARTPLAALVVVRRDQLRLYDLFRQTAEHVLWDRRQADRRVRQGSQASDRRRRERRGLPPATWDPLGFVITTDVPATPVPRPAPAAAPPPSA